ncbi:MAG: hypothetical protein ILM98_08125 [Kiritimatiellae bacterium]|nr:hypothetical protein [Kiritimatiellia bacterium]
MRIRNNPPQTPSPDQVRMYLQQWESNVPQIGVGNYYDQEVAVSKLFKQYPNNTEHWQILLKVTVLNTFYSTSIYDVNAVARHIGQIRDIDSRLKEGDENLVEEIQCVTVGRGDKQRGLIFYSFATKYCSHHNPEAFPIYDSFVDELLWFFSGKDKRNMAKNIKKMTSLTTRGSLKDYSTFKKVVEEFQQRYNLMEFTFKELDKYMWLLGKKTFVR